MRRYAFAAAVLILLAAAPTPASAASEQGHLTVASFFLPSGITGVEWIHVHACSKLPNTQGHDAYIISAPGATSVTVTSTSVTDEAMNVGFFDSRCGFIGGTTSATSRVSATAPPGRARWIYVWATNGANITFTATWQV